MTSSPPKLILVATLAALLRLPLANAEMPCFSSQANGRILAESQAFYIAPFAEPLLFATRPERVVSEFTWSADERVPPVRLLSVCDPCNPGIELTCADSSEPQIDSVRFSPLVCNGIESPLYDCRLDGVTRADIVTLATDVQTLFDWDLSNGIVVPIQDLSTRTLRFGFHLQLQRPF